ncbi:MAG: DUF1611 domain-containing protein [Saprospiraceae bacterium]|nr:DUF1611 domain-containing protein [Saprospiraceae bacterium]MCB9319095.1 DUF1611 domain-containing protein [Lewinellaceae bacterium]
MPTPAIVLTHGLLHTMNAKTAHGLLRGTERFTILAVIDRDHAGRDAGEVMDGKNLSVPVFASVKDFLKQNPGKANTCIIGVALEGGKLPEDYRHEISDAIEAGLNMVNGLHTYLSDDPTFSALANKHQVTLTDIRKPKSFGQLHFWTGEILQSKTTRIAVLGTDCAIGKRTTCRWLWESCRTNGIKSEMLYTGQTGWLQGYPYGFIFDSTLNDFVSGELEHAILECEKNLKPDVIFIEGQSALRNPSGPAGSELIISGACKYVVLQHMPARKYFDDREDWGEIPSVRKEIKLIRMLGAKTIALTLNPSGMSEKDLRKYCDHMEDKLGIPVLVASRENIQSLTTLIEKLIE